ncbi:MAG: methyltransferase, partial [Actinomycetes bacterium]
SFLSQARRLLRDGGMVVLRGALGWDAAVIDPAQRDAGTASLRAAAASLQDDEQLLTALLPVADGLLIATKRTV